VKVLLLGCRGMLGTDLAATAPAGLDVTGVGIEELDVTDHAATRAMIDATRPDWVVNATAYTAVDRAEQERDVAFAVNGDAVAALAAACAARDIGIVHYGTDYVFDGSGTRPWREDDPVAPLNAYGESKRAGERAVLESGARHLMLRTQWLYGLHGKSFPRTMWERATAGQPTRVVSDQHGSPTFTMDLAQATWRLLGAGATGLFHATNTGEASWYDVAARVFAAAGHPDLLAPCATADYLTAARRPGYSVLDTRKLRAAGVAMRPWRAALAQFLEALGARP
jgi:dTDP-4-dehydrorhamnose reductase